MRESRAWPHECLCLSNHHLISKITTCHFYNHSLDLVSPIPSYTLSSLALVHKIGWALGLYKLLSQTSLPVHFTPSSHFSTALEEMFYRQMATCISWKRVLFWFLLKLSSPLCLQLFFQSTLWRTSLISPTPLTANFPQGFALHLYHLPLQFAFASRHSQALVQSACQCCRFTELCQLRVDYFLSKLKSLHFWHLLMAA